MLLAFVAAGRRKEKQRDTDSLNHREEIMATA